MIRKLFHRRTTASSPRTSTRRRSSLETLENRVLMAGDLSISDATVIEANDSIVWLGSYITSQAGGLDHPTGMVLGPNGDLFVASAATDRVLRYEAATGTFLGTFVSPGSGGLDNPDGVVFGPDGNLYVASVITHAVLRYEGTTGDFTGRVCRFRCRWP